LGIRTDKDLTNTAPTVKDTQERWQSPSADAGAGTHPYLTVTWTSAGGAEVPNSQVMIIGI